MVKDIKINDVEFHKHLLKMKINHGFSSIEELLKSMEKVYSKELNKLRKN